MTKKTNGFEKPNHTQTPNSFFDEIMRDIDTMAELKVTLAIIRQTIGWHRKRTRYGIGKIERLTGLARNSVITGAEAAEARGTIKRIPTDGEAEWELVINDTPSNFEGANFEGGADVEGEPPQTLTKNPSNPEGLKRNKETLNKEDKEILLKRIELLSHSVIDNNVKRHLFLSRLDEDCISLAGCETNIIVRGLAADAEVWTARYYQPFANLGLELEFRA